MKKKIDSNQLKSIFNNFLLCSYTIGGFGCGQISNNTYNMEMPEANGGKDDVDRLSDSKPSVHSDTSNLDKLEALIKAGVDVNAVNNEGKTLLYIAVEKDNLPAVNALRKAGANVNTHNWGGGQRFSVLAGISSK